MSKHIELAKKLKALAERGVGGEKLNAEKMLSNLLKKHNITLEEIEGEKQQDYYFKLRFQEDYRLWHQIVKHVNYELKTYGKFPVKVIREYYLKGNYMTTCTPSEYIEIEAKYSFYKRLYDSELDVFYTAFLTANNLLVDNPNKEQKDFTRDDYEEWKRVQALAAEIKSDSYRKQITANV